MQFLLSLLIITKKKIGLEQKRLTLGLGFDVIDLKDDEDLIPIRQIVASVFAIALLSFCKLTLKLRDEKLKDEEFQLEEPYQHRYELKQLDKMT